MREAFDHIRRSGDFSIIEQISLPERRARTAPIPDYLVKSPVGKMLQQQHPEGLWYHQAKALSALGQGKNIVVSTGTASGKSLIFRSLAMYRIHCEPDARIIVFYPLRALAADQLRGWQQVVDDLGLPKETVGRIDGSVPPSEREQILERGRVVLMTPDVCHAWLMSRLAMPVVKDFIRSLRLVVMDEAHTLEGVFGSNFAFLIRRVASARAILRRKSPKVPPLQYVAATATISNPVEHLEALTGQGFEAVHFQDDGSPQYERVCMHIGAPEGEGTLVAREIQKVLLSVSEKGGFITFLDSRKGVEQLARQSQADLKELLQGDAVMPYRAGYDAVDRAAIEQRLQKGDLRGVISTSALELGIDLPHLAAGLNIGVPATRKGYRQRLGRIGRSMPGGFAVVGPPSAFTGFGMSYQEYHNLSVEPSYLYLENRFMQFAHARCLVDELEALGVPLNLPSGFAWPKSFTEIFAAAKPGGDRPAEFDGIAQIGGDAPQRNYPLRNVGEISFKIARGENMEAFGDIGEAQALRECYPGATYYHMTRAWEVVSWNANAYIPYIKVKPTSPNRQTKPRLRTWINAGVGPQDVLDGHFLKGPAGFLVECQMQITETVEGYTDVASNSYRPYKELRQRNPNLRPRTRNFRTGGVLLGISASWFRTEGFKQWLADRLTAVFAREYSVLPQDVGSAATNITVRGLEGGGPRGDCIAIFDQTYGSLRLTESLYQNFSHLLDRLVTATDADEDERGSEFSELLADLRAAFEQFAPVDTALKLQEDVRPTGLLQCYIPGSIVSYREKGGVGTEVEIIQPTLMDGALMYQVKTQPRYPTQAPVKNWVAADYLEPTADGDRWEFGWWNAETEEFVEPSEGSDPPL